MITVMMSGTPVYLSGELPEIGTEALPFELIKSDLSVISFDELKGKKLILNVFPSIDTPVCAKSAREFNERGNELPNTLVLAISNDLPFAMSRHCAAEGLDNIMPLSAFRSSFGKDYGLEITTGPIRGLLARAVMVIDEDGKVIYKELVSDISHEPNYDKAISILD